MHGQDSEGCRRRDWLKDVLLAAVLSVLAARADHARAAATPPAAAAAHDARVWRQAHERAILSEFARLVELPNVASDAPGIERNVAALQTMLERRGLRVQVLRSGSAPPIVVGDLPARGAGARTIAFYAHYDGQPGDTLSWNGLPWTPVLRDARGRELPLAEDTPLDPESRLYARSAGDDKAPIMAMLVALDALRAAKRSPRFSLRIVLEGEEEAGSPHLADYMARYPALLRPDAWLICDGPVHQSGRMELGFGARGTTGVEMTVYGPIKSLHDGHYGNWVPNPIVRLANLIASMRDDDGGIRIAGFMDDVQPPSAAERAALAAVPDVESQLRAEFQIGAPEGGGESLNARLMRPALNVRGIQSGNVGERATNSIPTEARASLDFRLVPTQTPESVRGRVERHLATLGWTVVASTPDSATRVTHDKLVKLVWGAGYPPARTPLDLPLSGEITRVLTAIGHEPVRLPTLGGSVPMYLFQQPHGTPAIILPIANHDDNQHAPNENLRLQNLWDGIEVFAALFATLKP
jgi:acetylornithine deacetylase/succinyl-diaminopimelate desuccinylase-like protein